MSEKRIHESLILCLQRHRQVFWYDPAGEWKKSFESFEHENGEKIAVNPHFPALRSGPLVL